MLSILLESALRSLLLGVVAWSLLKLFRVQNPQAERVVWVTVLVTSIAMPALMRWARVPTPAPAIDWAVAAQPIEVAAGTLTNWSAIAFSCYFAIAALLLARLMFGLARSWRTCSRAKPVTADWTAGLDIRASDELHAPATFASSILLPLNHQAWSDVRRAAVLTHECEHLKNRDFQIRLLAHLHRAIFWFNPLAWWLPKRLAMLGEQLSDDAAIGLIGDRTAYAQMLVDFSRSPADRLSGALAMARLATVSDRVERILGSSRLPQRIGRMKQLGVACALAPVIWVAAGCSGEKSPPAQSASQGATGQNTPPQSAPPESAPPQNAVASTEPEPKLPQNAVLPKSNKRIPLSAPEYPSEARRKAQTGMVVLQLHVVTDGSLDDVRVKKSSGFELLDEAAAKTARTWRVDAGTVDGKPTPMWGQFAITFKLED